MFPVSHEKLDGLAMWILGSPEAGPMGAQRRPPAPAPCMRPALLTAALTTAPPLDICVPDLTKHFAL